MKDYKLKKNIFLYICYIIFHITLYTSQKKKILRERVSWELVFERLRIFRPSNPNFKQPQSQIVSPSNSRWLNTIFTRVYEPLCRIF